eukprot:symbB.v1.2.025314.t1/scaffold2450.1/size78879/10
MAFQTPADALSPTFSGQIDANIVVEYGMRMTPVLLRQPNLRSSVARTWKEQAEPAEPARREAKPRCDNCRAIHNKSVTDFEPSEAKPKPKPRNGEWLYNDSQTQEDDVVSSDSGDEGFRMFAGQELKSFAPDRLKPAVTKIVDLVDFEECNPPASPRVLSKMFWYPLVGRCQMLHQGQILAAPSRAADLASQSVAVSTSPEPPRERPPFSSHATLTAGAAAGFSMPMRSKDDVLLEEIHYLRQMLADSNEEKRIQVAIIRDEVAEKQRVIDELRSQTFAEATLQAMKHAGEVARRLESVEAQVELANGQVLSLEEKCLDLERSKQHHEAESLRLKAKLDFWEASDESLAALSNEPAVYAWDSELREACQASLRRLADRRVALRVATYKARIPEIFFPEC